MKVWAVITALILLLTACAAHDAGAPVENGGVTPAIGELGGMCGGFGGFQCKAEGTYCKSESGLCRELADYAGTCTPKPEACTMEYKPVCGCDGATYGNACSAAAAGASIAYEGECAER